MKRKEFQVKLVAMGGGTAFKVPFSVERVFGSKARVPVRGKINGFPYRSSIFPMGEGTHYMVVNKETREGAGARAGDIVRVTMEVDTALRTVTVPNDLRNALAKHKGAGAAFQKLSYTHKKEIVHWIEEAKKGETRARRISESSSGLAQADDLNAIVGSGKGEMTRYVPSGA